MKRLIVGLNLVVLSAVGSSAFAQHSIDGSGNNGLHEEWGKAHTPLLRKSKVAYGDGADLLAGSDRPNARFVSNLVHSQKEETVNSKGASDFVWVWGQFIDHDVDLTDAAAPDESQPISVAAGDEFFDPAGNGDVSIAFSRSVYQYDQNSVRQQINQITSYIDASNIYGSDQKRANELRAFDGSGKLKVSEGNLLPFNVNGFPNAPSADMPNLFLSGDVRANEQIGLTAMHTLFMREHNRICDELNENYPSAPGGVIYDMAKSLVIAQIQHITYSEFLPMLVGELPPYRGYDSKVNASIANEFSTVGYRVGHTMLPHTFKLIDADGQLKSELELRNAFFSPQLMQKPQMMEQLFRGYATQKAQEVDVKIIDDVRNFLFGAPGSGGFDLASLNIQRGRDHGISSYNILREAYGLSRVASIPAMKASLETKQKLQSVYRNINLLDPWTSGLAEEHAPNAMVGELFQAIIKDQFIRLRDGDRNWYSRTLSRDWKNWVESQSLAKVIVRNTGIKSSEISSKVFSARN